MVLVSMRLKWRNCSVPNRSVRVRPLVPAGAAPVNSSATCGRFAIVLGSLWKSRLDSLNSVEKLSVQSANHWPTSESVTLVSVYQ